MKIDFKNKWHKTSIHDSTKSKLGHGVYIVVSETAKNEPFGRLCMEDHDRILYIGSGNLSSRLSAFKRVVKNGLVKGHAGAVTFNERLQFLQGKIQVDSLVFYYDTGYDSVSAKRKEQDLFNDYISEFGEMPTINKNKALK